MMASPKTLLFAILALSTAYPARGDTSLPADKVQCTFRNTLEVGASVTGEIGQTIPMLSTLEWLLFGVKAAHYEGSPSQFFISHYWREDAREFRKAYLHPDLYTRENLAHIYTNTPDKAGAGQVESLLNGEHQRNFQRASLVMGLDLFYWDSIWNLCGYGQPKYGPVPPGGATSPPTRTDTEFEISRLIEAARKDRKVLFLGTVPMENPQNVLAKGNRPDDHRFWWPQTPACVDSINRTLRENCDVAEGCYLIDVATLAADLNSGKKLHVDSSDTDLGLFDARPDGIHLSYLASKALSEKMIQVFEETPPLACPAVVQPGNSGD